MVVVLCELDDVCVPADVVVYCGGVGVDCVVYVLVVCVLWGEQDDHVVVCCGWL